MTRESFEKALMDNEIWWNSMVELEALNPNHKSALFNLCPKTITFVGALGYKKTTQMLVCGPRVMTGRALLKYYISILNK